MNLDIENAEGKAMVEMTITTATTESQKDEVIQLLKKSLFQAMDLLTSIQKEIQAVQSVTEGPVN